MANRITTTTEQLRAAQNADQLWAWPTEAGEPRPDDGFVFEKLQMQRSHDDWTPSDLISLAHLAGLMVDLTTQQEALRSEGHVIFDQRLQMKENPRFKITTGLLTSINATARRLGLTSMSVADKRSQANRGKLEREARTAQGTDMRSKRGDQFMN